MIAGLIFALTYSGIALGKLPWLTLDRTGIALVGAVAMVAAGVMTPQEAFQSIDIATILLLYALMIISAQLRLGGFYTMVATRSTASVVAHPYRFLLISMLLFAGLSAVLANDIICFACTPALAVALLRTTLNPVPFLLSLAISSNIGSAATIIGNPQNMLIGQVGTLNFSHFLLWCTPPALLSLLLAWLLIALLFRNRMVRVESLSGADKGSSTEGEDREDLPLLDRWQTAKGLAAVTVLILLLFTSVPRELSAITIAGILLCSRKLSSRKILALVDWHLITLFCALFILIHGVSLHNNLLYAADALRSWGIDIHNATALTALATLFSNLFSNVPAVMMMIPTLDPTDPTQWYTLAVASTFAGNLTLLGSIANLIVVEQAAAAGITISFRQHLRVGLPVTMISLLILLFWI